MRGCQYSVVAPRPPICPPGFAAAPPSRDFVVARRVEWAGGTAALGEGTTEGAPAEAAAAVGAGGDDGGAAGITADGATSTD